MNTVRSTVLVVGLGTMAIKAAGPLLFPGSRLGRRPPTWLESLSPALLAALVVTSTVADGRGFVLDERGVGVVLAGIVLALRGPLILSVATAALITATLRALQA